MWIKLYPSVILSFRVGRELRHTPLSGCVIVYVHVVGGGGGYVLRRERGGYFVLSLRKAPPGGKDCDKEGWVMQKNRLHYTEKGMKEPGIRTGRGR